MQKEDRTRMFRFGAAYFPADLPDAYKWQPQSVDAAFKGIQVRLSAALRDTVPWSNAAVSAPSGTFKACAAFKGIQARMQC